MKMNNDYWKSFTRTGRIDDYLNYIACTQEEGTDEFIGNSNTGKEGGMIAGINYNDRDGSFGHAGW